MSFAPIPAPVVRDARYAVRMLRKTPGFTLVALITLAAGIGVNTAVFSVVDALLLKPLPYPEPDRLAAVVTRFRSPRGEGQQMAVDGKTFLAIHDNATLVDTAASGGGFGSGVNLFAGGVAANIRQSRVSAGFFSVLGAAPYVGREFSAAEDRVGGPPVAVLAYELWTRVFGSDPGIVGRAITLKGEPYSVVGVMPKGFTTGEPVDVWTPLRPSTTGEGGGTNYGMIARLRPGATWVQADAEVDRLGSPVAGEGRRSDVTVRSSLVPLRQGLTTGIREPLFMLWAAVGLVLLIACVNIAGLLLARAGGRRREIAMRLALGSGRGAVIRQLLVESLLLALAGGALGIGVGWVVLEALKRLGADLFALVDPIALDGRVLAATLAIALATSVLFGLVPALHASRVDVQRALSEGGTRSVAGRAGWSRRLLVVVEVAMGVVLLVSAGLLVRTFVQLKSLNPGFDPSHVVAATLSLQDARYEDPVKVNRLFEDTLTRIRQYPGVQAAGVTLGLPYTRLLNLGFRPLDGTSRERRITNLSYVTPGYFEAIRVTLREGRDFTTADRAETEPVAIVNDEFARLYYKGRDARGQRIATAGAERRIVGVVGSTRTTTSGFQGYTDPLVTPPIVYVPATQTSAAFLKLVHTWFSPSWVVRSAGSIEGVAVGVREAIAAVDPMLPIAKFESLSDVQKESLAAQRFMMSLVLGLGAVALLLAAIGIHGLIASSVAERTRELGIRLALGATSSQVMRDVVGPGLTLAAAGVVIGAGAAIAVGRLLQSFLWGVQPSDPLTFGSVIVTLLAVALVASVVPALRILRLDPARTLRSE